MLLSNLGLIIFQLLINIFQIKVVLLYLYRAGLLFSAYQVRQLLFVLLDIVLKLLIQRTQTIALFDEFGILGEYSIDIFLSHFLVVDCYFLDHFEFLLHPFRLAIEFLVDIFSRVVLIIFVLRCRWNKTVSLFTIVDKFFKFLSYVFDILITVGNGWDFGFEEGKFVLIFIDLIFRSFDFLF